MHGDDWLILNLQASSANIGQVGKFTLNLGVFGRNRNNGRKKH
ncbi:hypothetical protein KX729_27530 [Rhizobium sp. XQZ8]|nr:hypothetical protein [Rhizobium populisoli]